MMPSRTHDAPPTARAAARQHSRRLLRRNLVLWSVPIVLVALSAAGPAAAQAQPPAPRGVSQAPPTQSGPQVPPQVPPQAAALIGVWLDDTGRGAVEIKACGASLCGNIFWLQEPFKPNGTPVTDANNPDGAKRSRPVCGLQVIGNVRAMPDGSWDEGWVYDPKVGKSYDLAIAVAGRDRLSVTGYKGVKFLSRTFIWTLAPACLPRCDVTQTQNAPGGAAAGGVNAKAGAAAAPATGTKPSAQPPPTRATAAPAGVIPPPGQGRQ